MKLTFDRIWELSRGAVRREILDGALCLRRFTPEEQLRYRARREESYLRGLATAGMRIVFETESPSLTCPAPPADGSATASSRAESGSVSCGAGWSRRRSPGTWRPGSIWAPAARRSASCCPGAWRAG